MDYEVSFSNPHRVFLSEDKREELGVTNGDPLEMEFEVLDGPLVTKISPLDELNTKRENQALFYILHYCIDDVDEVHGGIFENFRSTITSNGIDVDDNLTTKEGINDYLDKISHLNEYRLSNSDFVLGCGIADILARNVQDDVEKINSPFSDHTKSALTLSLSHDLPNPTEIGRYDGELKSPSNMYICTYRFNADEKQKEALKEHIVSDKYIHSDIRYEYLSSSLPAHGMILEEEEDIEENDIMIASDHNVKFVDLIHIELEALDDSNFQLDTLEDFFVDDFDSKSELDFEVLYDDASEVLRVNLSILGQILFIESEEGFEVRVMHVKETDTDDVENLLVEIIKGFEDKHNVEFETQTYPYTPMSPVISDTWVMDTNAIYRQKTWEDYNSIAEFVLTDINTLGKRILIPWNVICEINRHKDASSSRTKNSSVQGMENLSILRALDSYDILDLDVERIPEEIDNSMMENSGVTDLAILNKVPDEGVLLTDDGHLLELAELLEVNATSIEQLGGFIDRNRDNPYWDALREELGSSGPLPYKDAIEFLQDVPATDSEDEEPEQLIQNRLGSAELVRFPDDGEMCIALTENKSVIPTFALINEFISRIERIDGGHYLDNGTLESIRSALGGLPTSYRPLLTFIIPAEYVFKSSEIQQIDSLESLRELNNCNFETVKFGLGDMPTEDIENAIIRSSIDENAVLLCSPEEDTRKYGLMGVDYTTVTF